MPVNLSSAFSFLRNLADMAEWQMVTYFHPLHTSSKHHLHVFYTSPKCHISCQSMLLCSAFKSSSYGLGLKSGVELMMWQSWEKEMEIRGQRNKQSGWAKEKHSWQRDGEIEKESRLTDGQMDGRKGFKSYTFHQLWPNKPDRDKGNEMMCTCWTGWNINPTSP